MRPDSDPSSREYPKTTWGILRRLDPAAEGYKVGIETLCRRYWGPIRHYVRAAWASSDADADDLTQEFFLWLIQGEVLARYATERGSFRNFLKGLLRNFGRNHRRATRRLKRGGESERLSLEAGAEVVDPRASEAEQAFDREFVGAVTARAVAQVKERLEASGRAVQWRLFSEHDLEPASGPPSYKELASRHGVSESDVTNYLHRVRALLRDEIRLELADTVANDAELEAEWRHVIG
jgi:RNA polymerase sigma factor (sigma-70 family)